MTLLISAAASIAVLHTLLGPDHYLPFAAMSHAGKWPRAKTFWVTFLCGVGHVAGSVVLGAIGIILGLAVSRMEAVGAWRGEAAAWALIALGFVYFVWGLRKAYRGRPHEHFHAQNLTPWILFTIFVFGPCEPLIPLLMYPAAKTDFFGLILVMMVFSVFTIGTMLTMVGVMSYNLSRVSWKPLERYSHALAGAVVCFSGLGIKFLGL